MRKEKVRNSSATSFKATGGFRWSIDAPIKSNTLLGIITAITGTEGDLTGEASWYRRERLLLEEDAGDEAEGNTNYIYYTQINTFS